MNEIHRYGETSEGNPPMYGHPDVTESPDNLLSGSAWALPADVQALGDRGTSDTRTKHQVRAQ